MAFFFLKKTAQKVRRTFTKIAAVNIINSVKRTIFSKGNGFLLVKNMSFQRLIKRCFSKGNGFLLSKKQRKTCKGIEKCLSKGSGFLLNKTVKFDVELEVFFKGKRFPLGKNETISQTFQEKDSSGNGFLLNKFL